MVVKSEYRSSPEERLQSKDRRDERREAGDCVNHTGVPAVIGVRCRPCAEKHGGYSRVRITEFDMQLAAAAMAAPKAES